MALSKTFSFKGIEVPDGYITIQDLVLSKESMVVTVIYRQEKDSAPLRTDRINVPYDIEGDNPFKQGYNYIKVMDKFAGALDV
jgi:hypothetical protein